MDFHRLVEEYLNLDLVHSSASFSKKDQELPQDRWVEEQQHGPRLDLQGGVLTIATSMALALVTVHELGV